MKHLPHVFALTVSCVSMAAVASVPATQPQAQVAGKTDHPVRHHPLFEVKFVLLEAPPEQQESPHLDFGNGQSAIVPLPLSSKYAVPFRGQYMNPNMYWCTGWGCMDGPN